MRYLICDIIYMTYMIYIYIYIQQRSEAAFPATAPRRFGPGAQCIDFSFSRDAKYDCNGLETQNIDFWWSRNTKYLFVVVWRHKQFVSSGLERQMIDSEWPGDTKY